jgi:NAD(P)-dependent dehydrogenase (short-subunit alcohol dehydrogenase family)
MLLNSGFFHTRSSRIHLSNTIGRIGTHHDVAQSVVFLASPATSYGGWTEIIDLLLFNEKNRRSIIGINRGLIDGFFLDNK